MAFLKQLREVAASVLPIVIIALVAMISFSLADFEGIIEFLGSAILVIVGLTFFLLGVDLGLLPVGNFLGAKVMSYKKLSLLLAVGFFMGSVITLAEPDVQVLASQVSMINPSIPMNGLVLAISLGVGLFVAISFFRAVSNCSIKLTMGLFIGLIFLIVAFSEEFFISVAFDSGGATTGPMAVPFIMALGLGIAEARGSEDSSFGYTGIASFGPVLFVLLFGLLGDYGPASSSAVTTSLSSLALFLHVVGEVFSALCPLLVIALLLQVFLMKLPVIKATRIFMGFFYTFLGLVLFLFAVKNSFMDTARLIGERIGSMGLVPSLLLSTILGSAVVLAEPAIWILTEQVEEVSQGRIKKAMILLFMCVGVSAALDLAVLRIFYSLNILFFLIPCYIVVISLMIFTPNLFVAIAFDSGGVATGPMSSTFLLPFTMGLAGIKGNLDLASFGLIGLVAVMPIISIEILGFIYGCLSRRKERV